MLKIWLIASVLASSVYGAPSNKRSPKTLSLPFDVVKNNTSSSTTNASKRDKTVPIYPDMLGLQYLVTVQVGSNKQTIQVGIDTGSSDFWVPGDNVECNGMYSCTGGGTFNPKTSTTFHNLSKVIDAAYLDGHNAIGWYGKDDYWFEDGTKLPQFQFGVMDKDGRPSGLLGLGYNFTEATTDHSTYPNFPFALKDAGIVDKAAYSLYLNSAQAEDGNLLFGGIDKAKYSGEMKVLDVVHYRWLGVELGSITTARGKNFTVNTPVYLDSGTTYMTMTPDILKQVYENEGLDENGTADCDKINKAGSTTFNFGELEIKVPNSELYSGEETCKINIDESSVSNMFGDIFLRSAYVAYNLDTNKIGLAQVKYTDDSSVVDFWF
ncbi:uncharacterized protein LODBEIA_P59000 [Lodderomyces beijingensis]|uniref:candidapepsin n=1 Tax=Lodderomyces beijingensis TaxID=1775926 RepID=A0ABP0ZW05_9ASCO